MHQSLAANAQRFLALAILLCAASMGRAQENSSPSIDVGDVRVGFDHNLKSGVWSPIAFEIICRGTSFTGSVEIATPDHEGVNSSLLLDNITVARDATRTIRHYVRVDSSNLQIFFTLRDQDGKVVHRHTYDNQMSLQQSPGAPPSVDHVVHSSGSALLVGIGDQGSFRIVDEQINANDYAVNIDHEVVSVKRVDELPSQWFAYGPVDVIVLATSQTNILDALDPARSAALQTWVRQGGRLIVSVASNWQVVAESFLGAMLPATPTGVETVGRLSSQVRWIEGIAGGKQPLPVNDKGMLVARLASPRGVTMPLGVAEANATPLIVRGTYGHGEVILLGSDIDQLPFRDWSDVTSFWRKLLGITTTKEENVNNNAWQAAENDVTRWMDNVVNDYPQISIVPFSWVALLILGYIALIGPIDYFFLKYFVKKLELTWFTFPLIVAGVSIAAYFAAYSMKGDKILINRLEVVDVDADSKTLRGFSYVSLFSPVIDRYSIAFAPALGHQGTWEELGMGRAPLDRVASTTGPLAQFSPMYAFNASGGLFNAGGYGYAGAEPSAVMNVPIKVWSTKAFQGQWLAQAGPTVDTDLRVGDLLKGETSLVGSLTNRLPSELKNALLFYEDRVYELGNVAPGQTVNLTLDIQKARSAALTDDRPAGSNAWTNNTPINSERTFLNHFTFGTREKPLRDGTTNLLLSNWSMARHVETGKALLIAQIDAPGAELWINQRPTPGQTPPTVGTEKRTTFFRLALEPRK